MSEREAVNERGAEGAGRAERVVVVVVGGTSGIGLAAARRQLAEGRSVVVVGRRAEKLEGALKELRAEPGVAEGQVEGRAVDAADEAAIRALFAGLGPVDHVVLAATGATAAGPFREVGAAALREAAEGKLIAQSTAARAALEVLRPGGSLTFVTAASAGAAMPGTAGLAAVNAAVEAMVPVLAVECAPLRVNAVSPGVIRTGWWDWLPEEQREATFAGYAEASLRGRVGEPEEIADALAFLIGNGFTTGIVLRVDGGARLVAGR